MQEIKDKIEAVLFITGKAMTIEEIAQFCNIGSVGTVKEAMQSLRKDYSLRLGGIELSEEEGRFRLNIKKEYNHLSTKLLSAADLDTPTQATLALIAYKQPILQSDIIKMRGNTAYDHIHALKAMEFIISEKSGRTRTLKLGAKFFDYFDVVEETLKQRLYETAEKQEKLIPETPLEEKSIIEEAKEITHENEKKEAIPLLVKEKKKRTEVQPKIAVSTNSSIEIPQERKKVVLRLDADDFGSVC